MALRSTTEITICELVRYSSQNPKPKKRGVPPKDITKICILDPACGSGFFLLGVYQYLLDWHRDWYVANDPEKWATGKNRVLYQCTSGDWRLTTAERKRILLNNIYGVDIDKIVRRLIIIRGHFPYFLLDLGEKIREVSPNYSYTINVFDCITLLLKHRNITLS